MMTKSESSTGSLHRTLNSTEVPGVVKSLGEQLLS